MKIISSCDCNCKEIIEISNSLFSAAVVVAVVDVVVVVVWLLCGFVVLFVVVAVASEQTVRETLKTVAVLPSIKKTFFRAHAGFEKTGICATERGRPPLSMRPLAIQTAAKSAPPHVHKLAYKSANLVVWFA